MSAERLFELLPAIYRIRDAQSGRVLEALLEVVQGEVDRVAENIDDLYDSWFIETCPDWVVPYIGELVSARAHYAFGEGALSLRAFVANTLNFRRRKGTASMLEDLCLALTGWPCRAVELFTRVATTQHVNHARPGAPALVSIRDAAALERLAGPFDASTRTVDVRSVALGRARPNVPNVALFVFRLQAIESVDATAAADLVAGPGRFRFDSLGVDRQLFGPARTLPELALDVGEADVPAVVSRRALFDELRRARAALAAGSPPQYRYFPAGQEILSLHVVGEPAPIPPEQIQICNLDDWTGSLPTPLTTTLPDGSTFDTRVAVDPKNGRIAFLGSAPTAVIATYHYGAPSHLGATHAARQSTPAPTAPVTPVVPIATADWNLAEAPELADALTAWSSAGQPSQTFEIDDSGRYVAPSALTVPADCRLTLRARDGQRPIVSLHAPWPIMLHAGATLVLEGISIEGAVLEVTTVSGAASRAVLELRHVTLVPGLSRSHDGASVNPSATVLTSTVAASGALHVSIERSLVGAIDVTAGSVDFTSELHVSDSGVDAGHDGGGAGEAVRALDLVVARSTVLGATTARTLTATDSIFTEPVSVERTQTGCVRFSSVPDGSKTPKSYRCQPALALSAPDAESGLVLGRLKPAFTSVRFGDPGYLQLSERCPTAIRSGGSDGSEMGAYFHLHQPQREENLRRGLDEYLRFGLDAGFVFVT